MWSEALERPNEKGTGSHDLTMTSAIPGHFGHNMHSRGVVSRTSTYPAITPYISVDVFSRRRMQTIQ